VSRGEVRSSECRQLELFGSDRRVLRVGVWLTDYELWRLDAIAAGLGLSRSDAMREAVGWLAARHAMLVQRSRAYRVTEVIRAAEAWDPVGDHLAGAGGERVAAQPGSPPAPPGDGPRAPARRSR
jgi:hypothetical protein